MESELEDARKLAHGTYDDVIVAEHRQLAGTSFPGMPAVRDVTAPHVVLEMPEGSRVIDWQHQYEIDGVVGSTPPTLGASYRLLVGPATDQAGSVDASPSGSLRYETTDR